MKGFTLIELLVVITIIGILASAVLISFPGAVQRAQDSRIVSDMSQLRTKASVLYANEGNYGSVQCTVSNKICSCQNSDIKVLCDDIEQESDEDITVNVNDDGKGFCAVAHLPGSGKYFCVDGDLRAKEYLTSPVLSGACNIDCRGDNDCSCE